MSVVKDNEFWKEVYYYMEKHYCYKDEAVKVVEAQFNSKNEKRVKIIEDVKEKLLCAGIPEKDSLKFAETAPFVNSLTGASVERMVRSFIDLFKKGSVQNNEYHSFIPASKDLDNKIVEKRGLQHVPLFQEKKLSFRDELSELLHMWRGHKFWSENNKPITKGVRNKGQMMEEDKVYYNPLLDEFVDALHFALSIGLEREWNKYIDAFVVRNNKGNTKQKLSMCLTIYMKTNYGLRTLHDLDE